MENSTDCKFGDYEKRICKWCSGDFFVKPKGKGLGRRTPKNVRQRNAKTCNKDCGRKYRDKMQEEYSKLKQKEVNRRWRQKQKKIKDMKLNSQ